MKNIGFKIGCLLQIIYFIGYIALGTYCVITILSWFGKAIPFWINVLIGLIGGTLAIPAWIIGLILRAFGVF